MDSFTLDPAYNQEESFWDNQYVKPVPIVLISDCYVAPWINPSGINGANSSGRIPTSTQLQKKVVERAIGRFLLRNETVGGGWNNQEYYSGNPTDSYMAWWNQRGNKPVDQNAALNKLTSGPLVP